MNDESLYDGEEMRYYDVMAIIRIGVPIRDSDSEQIEHKKVCNAIKKAIPKNITEILSMSIHPCEKGE